jgi:hypothetical protein
LWGTADRRDPVGLVPLETKFTAFSADVSAGVAARFTNARARVGIWLIADGGYGWTPSQTMSLGADPSGTDSNNFGGIVLRSLAARGPFGRASLALTY